MSAPSAAKVAAQSAPLSAVAPEARQLALDLPHHDSRARDDFLPGPANEAALALIDAWPRWPAPVVALVGPEGSGKSHLAALFAQASGASVVEARALDIAALPGLLAGGALVVEDLGEGAVPEAALFHLLNLAAEQRAHVLVTARRSPAALAEHCAIRDLGSRLRAMPVVALGAPDDALLAVVALKLFADRQIVPDEGLLSYLLPRVERSIAALREVIAALDREALARKRPLTRALASELLRAREEAAGGLLDSPRDHSAS
ncbi:chromosomal replication initiation ATPase DnaA [Angulomicrobium tetraedrale]|uniref:Chromosomal replication initiation ATPase DnaA n=1 Tax=Ancylobacter tetraedralis TaxID=217068 RepID=A0A839Z5R1_9HYPH|nr:chromosomal replication initiator DnaA [Ancylobacter tetraedralis]MBB3770301.1 chromosomal replication initiation ATPase DnaA [Ancylobacter tetraedralis]